jgi:hypothetical protein
MVIARKPSDMLRPIIYLLGILKYTLLPEFLRAMRVVKYVPRAEMTKHAKDMIPS